MTEAVPAPAERHELAQVLAVAEHDHVAVCTCGKSWHATTKAKAAAKAETHARACNLDPCPGRIGFDTEVEAEVALGRSWRRQRAGRRPIRTYRCPRCQRWHLSTTPARGAGPQRSTTA
ncbi:hypothetical protein ACIGO9_29725 [Nocardia asteroides]|uniref:hypothetical protein n=1 Tax=Nocardia asteroides TaxID=1824 RepID=UPI0037C9D8BC